MGSDSRQTARHLKNLASGFGRQSKGVPIPYRDRARYWFYYLALARRGKMRLSTTRDAQYEDGFWKRGYEKYCQKINDRLARAGTPPDHVGIPSFAEGELQIEDLQLLMHLQVPFLIRDGAQALPVKRWTLDYLEEVAGAAPVPINEAEDQPMADVSRPTKSYRYYDFRTGTLAEVLAGIRAGGNLRTTTAEDVMHHDNGRLRQDLNLPYFERISGWERNQHHWLRSRLMVGRIVGAQLLVQPQNAFTLWHTEPGDNFFVLAKGVKDWALVHPYYTAAMQPRVKSTSNYHGSNIDIRESEDVLRARGFDGYIHIPKVRFQMQPGDMLRIPNHWWHTVVTQPGDSTVGVSIRAIGSANMTCPGYTLLRNLDSQYHAMARAFGQHGRINDGLIGYPRQSRAASKDSA